MPRNETRHSVQYHAHRAPTRSTPTKMMMRATIGMATPRHAPNTADRARRTQARMMARTADDGDSFATALGEALTRK